MRLLFCDNHDVFTKKPLPWEMRYTLFLFVGSTTTNRCLASLRCQPVLSWHSMGTGSIESYAETVGFVPTIGPRGPFKSGWYEGRRVSRTPWSSVSVWSSGGWVFRCATTFISSSLRLGTLVFILSTTYTSHSLPVDAFLSKVTTRFKRYHLRQSLVYHQFNHTNR